MGERQLREGQLAELSWLWQAAYGSYFAPFRQLMRGSLAWQAVSEWGEKGEGVRLGLLLSEAQSVPPEVARVLPVRQFKLR